VSKTNRWTSIAAIQPTANPVTKRIHCAVTKRRPEDRHQLLSASCLLSSQVSATTSLPLAAIVAEAKSYLQDAAKPQPLRRRRVLWPVALALPGKVSNDGALTPRSIRLRKSTDSKAKYKVGYATYFALRDRVISRAVTYPDDQPPTSPKAIH
jgi:hypothetical protein